MLVGKARFPLGNVGGEGKEEMFHSRMLQNNSILPGQQYSRLQNRETCSGSFCSFGSGIQGCEWSPFEMWYTGARVGFSPSSIKA